MSYEDYSWMNGFKRCRWSEREDKRLLEWAKSENKANGVVISSVHPSRNMNWEEISIELQRRPNACKTRLKKLQGGN